MTTVHDTRADDGAHMSGTEAIELVRRALDVRDDEALGDAVNRAIDAYLSRSPESCGMGDDIAERACIAFALRLDREPQHRLVRWAHVFDAAKCARVLLERLRRLAELEPSANARELAAARTEGYEQGQADARAELELDTNGGA